MSREDIIPGVRNRLQQAEEELQIACQLLRENGYPESADDLARVLKLSRTWSQPDGFLDWLAKPDPVEVTA